MSISIVILSAGKGSRMKSSTPKVLHKISGKEMLFHSIDVAKKISDDITIILYHKAELIQKKIEENYNNDNNIKFHIQDVENFSGTGGALRDVKYNNDKVLILNGDMPLITKDSLEKLINNRCDIAMSVINLDNPSGYGRVVIEDNRVKEIVEEKDCSDSQKEINSVNAGVYCVSKDILENYIPKLNNNNAQQEYYLTDIIKMAVDEDKIITPIYVKESEFKGVNSKFDLANAEVIQQDKIKKMWLDEGVSMRFPSSIYIDINASFEGECILESGVSIEGNTKIISSHIKTNSIVENSIIKNSDIGPLARIRPQSNIIDSHIGNFVEIKKSSLNSVKAGHLSYIGDSQIDSGTNIGAGVITCNYDGKNKFKTIIGKNVFVGSDTQLVAPIVIADDVIIGAGSTITKDVEKGSLSISRSPQKIIKNFFYKFFGEK